MRTLRYLDKYFEQIANLVLLSVMTFVMFIQVIARYILNSSMPWPDELSRYCFVTLVWFGCSLAVKEGIHLRVDSLLLVLPAKVKFWLNVLVNAITMLFFIMMCQSSFLVTLSAFRLGTVTPSMGIPQFVPYGLMSLGFGISALRSIQMIVIIFLDFSKNKIHGNESISNMGRT